MSNEVRTAVSNALPCQIIDYVHWECHKGEVNFLVAPVMFSSNLVEYRMLITTPSSKEVHWRGAIQDHGPLIYQLYEDVTPLTGSAGTVAIPKNFNRNFTTSGQTVRYTQPSTYAISSYNTALLYNGMLIGLTGGGVGVTTISPVGGEGNNSIEFILKPNTNYLIYLQNTAATANQAFFECDYYEEE